MLKQGTKRELLLSLYKASLLCKFLFPANHNRSIKAIKGMTQ